MDERRNWGRRGKGKWEDYGRYQLVLDKIGKAEAREGNN